MRKQTIMMRINSHSPSRQKTTSINWTTAPTRKAHSPCAELIHGPDVKLIRCSQQAPAAAAAGIKCLDPATACAAVALLLLLLSFPSPLLLLLLLIRSSCKLV